MRPEPGRTLISKSAPFLAASFAAIILIASGSVASADRVSKLSKKLEKSNSDKARIVATVSLGELKDKRVLKPLVLALRDKNIVVRAVAATALGNLNDPRALPALSRAAKDRDSTVRKRATRAIGLIRQKTRIASSYMTKNRNDRRAHYRIEGRESPILRPNKPELFVAVRSAADEASSSKKTRKLHAGLLRTLMTSELKSAKRLTMNTSIAKDLNLSAYGIDLSITRFRKAVKGPWIDVECELRIAISNERGKMISFLTGGAKIRVPKRSFRTQLEPMLRREALDNAVRSVREDLVRYLLKTSGV